MAGGGPPPAPPEIQYLKKNGKGAHTYILSSAFGLNEFNFGVEDHLPIVIDCTALNGNKKSSKSISIIVDDSNSNTMLFDLWFGNSAAEVVKASQSTSSCQIPAIEGKGYITLPVSTSFFAIDWNDSGQAVNSFSTTIIITVS